MEKSDADLRNVLAHLEDDRVLALAQLLKLHNPKDPSEATLVQTMVDEDRPFVGLSRDQQTEVLCSRISSAGGHTIGNLLRGGEGVSYREVVSTVAKRLKVTTQPAMTVAEIEGEIAKKALNQLIEQLTPEQREELSESLEQEAARHGKSFKKEGGALAALAMAQLSGFGVYMAASTVVGALTGALGLTLSFGFYTAMSSAISVIIGPIGWGALGIAAIYKLGSPNMKALLPAVLLIAAERRAQEGHLQPGCQ